MFLKASPAVFWVSAWALLSPIARRAAPIAILAGIQRTTAAVIMSARFLTHLNKLLGSRFIVAIPFRRDLSMSSQYHSHKTAREHTPFSVTNEERMREFCT